MRWTRSKGTHECIPTLGGREMWRMCVRKWRGKTKEGERYHGRMVQSEQGQG